MISPRSKSLCLVLAIIGNLILIAGLHRYYTGRYITGTIMLLTMGGFFVWTVIDVITLLTNGYLDSQRRPVKQWIL
ncbi:MAG: hypothetical protein CMF43_00285 [Legionellales bacterium]|jgi:TM2 domain-containing membrane protein YozV|nr:hypothetical protein [Legionellales bacterium]